MKEGNMDQEIQPLPVVVVGFNESRTIEKRGDELVPGETSHELELKFPDGSIHTAKVSSETVDAYLAATGQEKVPPVGQLTSFLTKLNA
jgi:hypothetical protein